nr:glycoside hydrolase family 36 protein [Galbitalea soli]
MVWADDRPVSLGAARTASHAVVFEREVPIVEILTVDGGHVSANHRLIHTAVGAALRYVHHDAWTTAGWAHLELTMEAPEHGIRAVLRLSMPEGVAALRSTVTVTALPAATSVGLLSVASWSASFGHTGPAPTTGVEGWSLLSGRSDWLGEGRWSLTPLRGHLFPTLAQEITGHNPRGSHSVVSTGTWSSGTFHPVAGVVSDSESICWLWQVEHNGAWRWEIGENTVEGFVSLSGPTDLDHQWFEMLAPGESFTSVPVAIALGGDVDAAVEVLTAYRRAARRGHPDNEAMPVVFNDYMNTLGGDPTSAKLLPLIDAAARTGAEIFCIDAGWYDDGGDWWDSVGEWMPSASRFPEGLASVVQHIRDRGMTPGLWLEPEVVGTRSPMADLLPTAAFLQRGGRRIVEHDRLHLDLRHPAARAHLDAVVDRLVAEFGIGYFKLDYNINPGAGTDAGPMSVGAGLLGHNRAHLDWLDGVLDRHPDLVLENCSSGAMRTDFAMLGRLQLQSTTDQQDPLRYPPIAATAPLSMLPEQAANWAYPQPAMTPEESAFTLATAMLGRFYLSGHVDRMTEPQLALVTEAVARHKALRPIIRTATPFWPLGLPSWTTPWVALGLATSTSRFVTIWNRSPEMRDVTLHLPDLAGADVVIRTVFPEQLTEWGTTWDAATGALTVRNPTGVVSARTIELITRDR